MTKKKEVRTLDITNIKTRNSENEPLKVSGYAAVFNSRTSIGDFFDEIINPGAFSNSISNGDVRALYNHNWDKVLGRTKSGTLRLSEDERGLKFEVDLPDTTAGRDLEISMDRGDIDQCSFGFYVTDETWNYNEEPAVRTINEVELYEITILALPAYEDTEAHLVRSKELDKTVEKRIKLIQQINKSLGETK